MKNATENSTTANPDTPTPHELTDPPEWDSDAFGPGVTWRQIERRSEANGYHYFDKETKQFFGSRLNGTPEVGADGRAYGVVSQDPPHGDRYYQVIRVTPDGKTERPRDPENPYDGMIMQFRSRAKALKVRDALAYYHRRDEKPRRIEHPPEHYAWF